MSWISTFEDLANETIDEILIYFNHCDIYNAFYNLNNRFAALCHRSNAIQCINMTCLSKMNYRRYLTEIVLPNSHRIVRLHLGNRWMFEEIFSSIEHAQRFRALRTITLDNMVTFDALDRLAACPHLSSLTINAYDGSRIDGTICQSLYSFPPVKSCKMSTNGKIIFVSPFDSFNEQSSLDHLILKGRCDIHLLPYLLSKPLQLRRLSIDRIENLRLFMEPNLSSISDRLTHLSLKLYGIPFDSFEPFLIRFPSSLQVLEFSFDDDQQYLNSNRWERLITAYFPNLSVFDIEHVCCTNYHFQRQLYENQIQGFNSPFWLHRNCFFGYQHGAINGNLTYHVFYSIQPYRYYPRKNHRFDGILFFVGEDRMLFVVNIIRMVHVRTILIK